ncbi:MAG: M90 family metallopeptidase [Lacipirellulaceae bacterium]
MLFSWLKNRRRRRWLSERAPSTWEVWLKENVWHYNHLDGGQQRRVLDFVTILFHEKEWVGGSGFELADEMRVTIAGQAALLTLGFGKPFYFDRLHTIIVYPSSFQNSPISTGSMLIPNADDPAFGGAARAGEAWLHGPIILSWDRILYEGQHRESNTNLVLHEFAHHMDGLDGRTDGAPPLTDHELEKDWYRVIAGEYHELRKSSSQGRRTLLDPYGAENHAEFFAVATECFFTRPHRLYDSSPELAVMLEKLFGQDTRTWIPER